MNKIKLMIDIKNAISSFGRSSNHLDKSMFRDILAEKLYNFEQISFSMRYKKYILKIMSYKSDAVMEIESKMDSITKSMNSAFEIKDSCKYSALVDQYCNLKDEQNRINGRFF